MSSLNYLRAHTLKKYQPSLKMLYLLPDGHIYALRVDQASNVESLVVGCVEEGRLRILGEMAVEVGVLQGVKCNGEGLYISVERGGKSLYYLVSAI